jgi:hypothetical protein
MKRFGKTSGFQPLWRGFYFSEDMLSDVHTVDVSYRTVERGPGVINGLL